MARRGGWPSVRGRLLIIALLPMLVLTPILLGITMQRWLMRTDQILAARVTSDLTVGRQYLDHLTANTARDVAAIARSAAYRDASPAEMPAFLEEARKSAGLDFLMLTGTNLPGGVPSQPQGGLAVFTPTELEELTPGLAARAEVPLIPTEGSSPTDATSEDRGLVVLATDQVILPEGVNGRLVGGLLLNRNEDFIDRISALVYPASDPALSGQIGAELDPGLDLGVITLFLGDTRISTTLRPTGTERAIGTRASAAVSAQVLGVGQSWHDTAFVVNGWYISAYEALTDVQGNRVGMLYAGIPKVPYTKARQVTLVMIGAAFLLVGGFFVPLALSWARGIFRPLAAMRDTIALVEAGDMGARTGPVPGAAEIALVSTHLDALLALLSTRDQELRGLNADLNARVEERTQDLTRANQALRATSRQLILAEKLATIGEVTAGVAHEINNPLAVISGNLEVIRMVLAERASDVAPELRLIDEQIRRINALVAQLLQFARPEEFTDGPLSTDPAAAIRGLKPLIRHLLARSGVVLVEEIHATRLIRMNPHELQQVLINLVSNAVQAMPQGGQITLRLEDGAENGRDGVVILLSDNGPGMDPAILARAFDPFFTTRGREGGTGLGLPICLNLVTRQDGSLTADSIPCGGTRFRIFLPMADDSPD
ncbi:ATP-binding protein [Paracoccus sp. IB05]|uniref:sensor histidine kinase n=1 Tax=Paracoccus sp. IB05 TaxID=2779367 RepID=UPI0018E84CD5|nr:ATP-binding protein [Paracoccus sp. IB05]MBJ2149989.1 cache domain-containing protein [Paracoccus sp. IB05]